MAGSGQGVGADALHHTKTRITNNMQQLDIHSIQPTAKADSLAVIICRGQSFDKSGCARSLINRKQC